MGNSNSDLLDDFDLDLVDDGEDVLVERPSVGVYRNGEYIEPKNKIKNFIARASVQPASGSTILLVPENQRDKEILTVFSGFKFNKKDIMIRDNKRFQIHSSQDWNVYTESIAVLIDVV